MSDSENIKPEFEIGGTILERNVKDGVNEISNFKMDEVSVVGLFGHVEKPAACTCQYPKIVLRNMNGHDKSCPIYQAWYKKHFREPTLDIDNGFKEEGVPMRRFFLQRLKDETGISRTGRVLEGVLTQSGKVITEWRPPHSTIGIYNSFEEFKIIHVDCHPSCNKVVWLDCDHPTVTFSQPPVFASKWNYENLVKAGVTEIMGAKLAMDENMEDGPVHFYHPEGCSKINV